MAWTIETELLARAVDELGLLAAERRHKTPPKPVQRPAWVTGQTRGLRSILAKAALAGRIRRVED